MYPLFETVCVTRGQIQNGHYHELRFRSAFIAFFGKEPTFSLFDTIQYPKLNSSYLYKLKIRYNEKDTKWSISAYINKIPSSLLLIVDDRIRYDLKFTDRSHLNNLNQKRAHADDVLIIKDGFVTDATYSNILFTDGQKIITPATPLLKGTCRARLLKEKIIQETPITPANLQHFSHFQLINAMNDFDENRWVSTQHIAQK